MNKMALFAIIGTAMFLLSGGISFAATPAGPTHIQPDPTLNVNATWSTFNSSWNPLEYYNGTSYNNLSTSTSNYYANPITINPTDIIAKGALQNEPTGAIYWNNTAEWSWAGGLTATNQSRSISSTTSNGITQITLTDSITGNISNTPYAILSIPINDYPSDNPAYDYITTISELTAPTNSHATMNILIANNSGDYGTPQKINSPPNQPLTIEHNLIYPSATFNTSAGNGYSNFARIQPILYLPNPTITGTYTITIYAFSMTSYPLTYGTNYTGAAITSSIGNLKLSSFAPSFKYKEISDNGYTVAVSQSLQDLTTQQNAISSGNYIEQVEYQGDFALPSAPDLSYGPANLTEQFNVSTSQTQVLDINGVSYLSTISGKNGTIQLLSPANPNSQIQFLQIVDYTQSQWNTISNSPGLFTLAGIEYYWWIAVGGLATLIGLGAAAKHAGTKADQERIRRGR